MSFAYNVKDQGAVHFVTFTVHQWADIFTRAIYVNTLIESFKYCQKEKGLEIFAWVVMSNHSELHTSKPSTGRNSRKRRGILE